jgi:hypothetical protein
MSKEGRRARRAREREQDVEEALRKLKFMEKRGVDIEVTPDGKVGAFVPGMRAPASDAAGWDAEVSATYEDLHQMHKNERERMIILEAWGRFQDEE